MLVMRGSSCNNLNWVNLISVRGSHSLSESLAVLNEFLTLGEFATILPEMISSHELPLSEWLAVL
jgi:hypothetical protein